jgi:transposase
VRNQLSNLQIYCTDQTTETFLRLHENAFTDFGGVAKVVRHDNLKTAVVRACLFDPDVNEFYAALAKHWDYTHLPTRPRNPWENGKQERSLGYVKDNALKGRRFNSLAEQSEYLQRWNRIVVRLRIHGTTRRHVRRLSRPCGDCCFIRRIICGE